MISYNSTQTKYANKSFNAIIKHLLNTYDMVRAEERLPWARWWGNGKTQSVLGTGTGTGNA